jgi:hypothetical protein
MNLKTCIKALLSVLLLAAVLSGIHAIEFVQGSGREVTSPENITRDRDFYYHRNTDDQHWYGTHKWAVRFDFSSVYPTYGSAQFVLSKVRAYLPITPNPITNISVAVHSNGGVAPGIIIANTVAGTVSDWIEFLLVEPVTVDTCWVVVTCSTAVAGPYISASAGGGTHSYFWNTNMPVEYFQNMYTAGIYSELLFTAVGSFNLSGTDLELYAFELKPGMIPGRSVYPEFTVINNSSQVVSSAYLDMTITSPNPEFARQDTIQIDRQIPPLGSVTITYDDPDYQQYAVNLPDSPTQLKVRAVLHSEYDAADTLFNNVKTRYYNAFNQNIPFKIVENFIRTDQAQNFLVLQDTINGDAISPLNYFPVITDPYYHQGAVQRLNWYGFSGQPMTVLGGDEIITGFIPGFYEDRYSSAIADLNLQKTFLTQNDMSLLLPSPYSNIQVRLTLRNPDTYVFSDNIEPTLLRQSRFYAALCKKEPLFGADRYVFSRWGAYQDTINTAITQGNSWLKQFSINVADLGLDSLLTDYDLIYWIQHHSNKQIIFSGVASLSQIVSGEDDTTPLLPLTLTLSPNPVKAGGSLSLNLTGTGQKTTVDYKIYNIKGQLTGHGSLGDLKAGNVITLRDIRASGLYLIKFVIRDKSRPGQVITQTRKFIVY